MPSIPTILLVCIFWVVVVVSIVVAIDLIIGFIERCGFFSRLLFVAIGMVFAYLIWQELLDRGVFDQSLFSLLGL